MTVAQTILDQLGGNRFIVMTGSSNFVEDKTTNTLRMNLAKNASKANRLSITLNPDDTYTMRFWRYTAPRWSNKTFSYSDAKIKEVKTFSGIYFDQMQRLFTEVTHLYTSL